MPPLSLVRGPEGCPGLHRAFSSSATRGVLALVMRPSLGRSLRGATAASSRGASCSSRGGKSRIVQKGSARKQLPKYYRGGGLRRTGRSGRSAGRETAMVGRRRESQTLGLASATAAVWGPRVRQGHSPVARWTKAAGSPGPERPRSETRRRGSMALGLPKGKCPHQARVRTAVLAARDFLIGGTQSELRPSPRGTSTLAEPSVRVR